MSTSKHTPGPWIAELNEKSGVMAINGPLANKMRCRASDGLGFLFAVRLATLETADKVMFPDVDPEMLAIAQVATAASDMLEALKGLVDALDGRVHSSPALRALSDARAAIAKAEGR